MAREKKKPVKVEPYGLMYESVSKGGPMFMRRGVGDAKDPETGNEYNLSAAISDMAPTVTSEKTGKRFSISWSDLINMAVEAGIDKE